MLSVYVRSIEHPIDRDAFAERLAKALNFSVAAADVLIDEQLLPDVCLSESSVRAPYKSSSTSAPPFPL